MVQAPMRSSVTNRSHASSAASTSGVSPSPSASNLLIPAGGQDATNTSSTTQKPKPKSKLRVPMRNLKHSHLHQPNRKANIALVVILIGLSLACLLHASYVMAEQMEDLDKQEHAHHVVADHEPKDKAVTPLTLDLEKSGFRQTIKSCLPSLDPKCQTYMVNKDEPRIAILAPPGDFGDWIFKWASKVMDAKLGSTVKGADFQRVSSVPPYGYGKTHGWTKLIRILPRSLLLGAADAIRGSLKLGQTQDALTLDDLKAALRMLLRYHCRISHLAAHTSVLTLDMDTLAQAPYIASEGLLHYLNLTAVAQGEEESPDMERKEDSKDGGSYFTREQDVIAMSSHVQAFASSLLTWIERHEHVNVKKELDKVLEEELLLSRNFTKWPCDSFWTTGKGPQKTHLSQFGKRLAKSLSPDCSAPYTECSVRKDRCEERGDALCKLSK